MTRVTRRGPRAGRRTSSGSVVIGVVTRPPVQNHRGRLAVFCPVATLKTRLTQPGTSGPRTFGGSLSTCWALSRVGAVPEAGASERTLSSQSH